MKMTGWIYEQQQQQCELGQEPKRLIVDTCTSYDYHLINVPKGKFSYNIQTCHFHFGTHGVHMGAMTKHKIDESKWFEEHITLLNDAMNLRGKIHGLVDPSRPPSNYYLFFNDDTRASLVRTRNNKCSVYKMSWKTRIVSAYLF